MTDSPRDDYLWDVRATPDPAIVRLELALARYRHEGAEPPIGIWRTAATSQPIRARTRRISSWPFLAAAAVLLLLVSLDVTRRLARPWGVVIVSAADDRLWPSDRKMTLRPGQWLNTGATWAARINVGRIGQAEIGPRSKVRVVSTGAVEHRLALAAGTLHARIWAPPRFFVVETKSALAIDLGCVYTLHVDSTGAGWLRVDGGEVELVGAREPVRVPAGNVARFRPGMGPGVPYPSGASGTFIRALAMYEARPSDSSALKELLRQASPATTITLWHLLPRVAPRERTVVYDRLAALVVTPSTVTRDGIASLDPVMLDAWRAALEQTWTTEPVPLWKKWWRGAWTGVRGSTFDPSSM